MNLELLDIPQDCRIPGYSPEFSQGFAILKVGDEGLFVQRNPGSDCNYMRIFFKGKGDLRKEIKTPCAGCISFMLEPGMKRWQSRLEVALGIAPGKLTIDSDWDACVSKLKSFRAVLERGEISDEVDMVCNSQCSSERVRL